MIFSELEAAYLASQDIGRLATVQADGTVQVSPVGFRHNTELDTIDIGGHRMAASRKFRNLADHDRVGFVVDDVVSRDPWRVRCLEIRGRGEAIQGGDGPWPGTDGAIIRIHPRRVISFGLDQRDTDPHLLTADARTVEPAGAAPDTRPALDDPAARSAAEAAAEGLAAELQAGMDRSSADTYDRSFAADVLWGSPYGATVGSFDELITVHRRLMAAATAPPSRFEVVAVRAPAPDVTITQIRRQAVDEGGFSEVALYTLVRRAGRWWLAAAQNTPVADPPAR